MNHLALEDVLRVIHRLPSLPTVVMELMASIEQEDVNIDTLARKIAQDQALTAKTLRLANSSFYGRAQTVSTITEAIAILGFRTVRNVVTTAGLMQSMSPSASARAGGYAPDLQPFWRHAIAVAVCARELAPHSLVNPDYAYTAGLLHDIGQLVLVTQFWTAYAEVLAYRTQHTCGVQEAERNVLGVDHAAVGQALTAHWKFPLPLQQAVGMHHNAVLPEGEALAAVVMVSDAIAHALGQVLIEGDPLPTPLEKPWARLGLPNALLPKVLARVEIQFAAASQILTV
jgi:putative nucleotidyltransferase with HDIG domain